VNIGIDTFIACWCRL